MSYIIPYIHRQTRVLQIACVVFFVFASAITTVVWVYWEFLKVKIAQAQFAQARAFMAMAYNEKQNETAISLEQNMSFILSNWYMYKLLPENQTEKKQRYLDNLQSVLRSLMEQHAIIAIGINLGVKGGFLCDLKGFIPSLNNFPSAATIVSTYQGRPGQWHQWQIKRPNFQGNVIAFLPLKMAEMTRIEDVTGLSMRVTTKNITVSSTTAEHLFSSIIASPLKKHRIAFSQRLDEAMLPEIYQQIWTFVRRYDIWTLTTGDLQIQWISTLSFTFPFAEIRWGLIYVTIFIIAGGAYILLLQMRSTTYLKTFFERDLFSKIFHNAPVGITVTNEHFRIIYANQADLAQHGFSSINEILNASSNIYAPPQNRSDIIASTPTEPFIRESINYRKTDGFTFPVRLKSIALHEAENNQLLGIVTFCEDISEEMTRRDELLELNRNYELLANQMTNFLIAQTHGHNGKSTT